MEKPEYIKNIETKESILFSKIKVDDIPIDTEFKNLEMVYIEVDHHTRSSDLIIYKSSIPFYLCLEKISENTYNGICYFEIKHLDRCNVYLTSKFKINKNADSDSTRTKK